MKLTAIIFFSILLLLGQPGTLLSQSASGDSLLYSHALQTAIETYHRAAGDQIGLLNGSQYPAIPYVYENNGHLFFQDKKPGRGYVVYDGIRYENRLLQLDELQDMLILQDTSYGNLQLVNERVTAFSIFNSEFIRIERDTAAGVMMPTAFYNIMYEGRSRVLKREVKTIREEPSTGVLQRFIEVKSYYFFRKDGRYVSAGTKEQMLKVFGDKKSELRQFIRKNKLKYRKDRDNTIKQVAAYYDQLR